MYSRSYETVALEWVIIIIRYHHRDSGLVTLVIALSQRALTPTALKIGHYARTDRPGAPVVPRLEVYDIVIDHQEL